MFGNTFLKNIWVKILGNIILEKLLENNSCKKIFRINFYKKFWKFFMKCFIKKICENSSEKFFLKKNFCKNF